MFSFFFLPQVTNLLSYHPFKVVIFTLSSHPFIFLLADHDACKINKGGCSHECVNLPMGFICVCPENMRLLMDNQCEGE